MLDRLDLRVQPFGYSVGHPVREVGHHVGDAALEHSGDVDDRFEP
jgi:hypothetical protein